MVTSNAPYIVWESKIYFLCKNSKTVEAMEYRAFIFSPVKIDSMLNCFIL